MTHSVNIDASIPNLYSPLIIGVGNDDRGDDAVGLIVVRKIGALALHALRLVEHSGECFALIDLWEGAPHVILVDAVQSGAVAGTIYRFNPAESPLPKTMFSSFSSHSFGIADTIELARTLKKLPPQFVVYGIEGKSFKVGKYFSPEVEAAAQKVVELIFKELEVKISFDPQRSDDR